MANKDWYTCPKCLICWLKSDREDCPVCELKAEVAAKDELIFAYDAIGISIVSQPPMDRTIVDLRRENRTLKNTARCPACGGEFAGEGYTDKVHFACKNCGGHFSLDIKKWNKIVHPNLPETEKE